MTGGIPPALALDVPRDWLGTMVAVAAELAAEIKPPDGMDGGERTAWEEGRNATVAAIGQRCADLLEGQPAGGQVILS